MNDETISHHSHQHHHHSHDAHSHHHHHHHHHSNFNSLNKAFLVGITLNIAFVIAEFLFGFISGSMGLLSDAGHNLTDVISLVLAMLAFRLSKRCNNEHLTYGYKKTTILVSVVNAILLFVAIGFIIYECIEKLLNPQPVEGMAIIIVATVGVAINGLTAWLFIKDKDKDMNVKGAYLHMLADTLVSVGVVISGLVITETHLYIIDPIIGAIIAVIIIISTWSLLRSSLNLLIDGVPETININTIRHLIKHTTGVVDVHHIHIWALSTTENALTAHVIIDDLSNMETIKTNIKTQLREMNIEHSTIEIELPTSNCDSITCK